MNHKINRHVDSQHTEKINSTQYWDQRFIDDWKENNGIEQSQFFSQIAVDNLPAWFIRYVEQHQPSFCDWGCAMGNGTQVLHELLSLKDITGIDFSKVAIAQARLRYPTIGFIAADILKGEDLPRFDVIFSSNTLEHFNDPWEIVEKLSCFANKFIVILTPFQEYNRHFEHFYTFETTNIPSAIRTSHYLTHFSIFNAAEYPVSYWNGHQVLLIYSTYSELAKLGLTLSDLIDKRNFSPPAPGTETVNTVDPIEEDLFTKIGEIHGEQGRLQENQLGLRQSLTECTQNILGLKEQLDLAADLLNRRLDGILAEQNATAEKLLLLNESLNSIRESHSRDLITRIRSLFSKNTPSKN